MKSDFTNRSQIRVLFCVLNWGLGHASRSIPVIHQLLSQGYFVDLASDGRAGRLLKSEFPDLEYFEMPGYKVSYPSENMQWNIASQSPKILSAISAERSWVRQMHKVNPYDILISDNRYGCRVPGIHNIMITHQISPLTGSQSTNWIASKISRRVFDTYDEVWIPDDESLNLSGRLGQSQSLRHSRFIGLLSRSLESPSESKMRYKAMAILSGPEPQRSIFESWVREEWAEWTEPYLIVRGVTEGSDEIRKISQNGYEVDFLSGSSWAEAVLSSDVIVGRAGYSSIMDYVTWKKKCILIPTPGQYEQEYLAEHIDYPGIHFRRHLDFDLIHTINRLDEVEMPDYVNEELSRCVRQLKENWRSTE